mgnify:CR=1 FL=1
MLTPYQYRLAHKRGMPPQRTPGQPNSFSAHSVPNPDLSGIPHCLNVFSKKQSQKQHGEDAPPIHIYPHCHMRTHPEPKYEKQTQYQNRQTSAPANNYPPTHARIRPASVSQPLGASVPRCLGPFSKKQTQSQDRQTSEPAHTYPSSIRDIPRRLSSLDALVPRSLGPFSKKQSQYQDRQDATGHQCLGASTPWPLSEKNIEDTPVAETQC